MVRKFNGRWLMCIDYIELNKACPTDPYPLPSINRLVDGTSKHGLLSFMDAYFRYNQICMHPMDGAKTTFITFKGSFCYKDCISLDLEVYVDDIVAKSVDSKQHYEILARVFDVLRKHKLKLNPEKCSFSV
ncbi:hypothetical protein CR513_50397, partial [Mucuna pruriens]